MHPGKMLGFFFQNPATNCMFIHFLAASACSLPHPPDVYQHNIIFLNAEGNEERLREHVNHKEVVSLVTVTT